MRRSGSGLRPESLRQPGNLQSRWAGSLHLRVLARIHRQQVWNWYVSSCESFTYLQRIYDARNVGILLAIDEQNWQLVAKD